MTAGLWVTVAEGFRPQMRRLWMVPGVLNVAALAKYFVNLGLGSNYLFDNAKPPNASLVDLLSPWRRTSCTSSPSRSSSSWRCRSSCGDGRRQTQPTWGCLVSRVYSPDAVEQLPACRLLQRESTMSSARFATSLSALVIVAIGYSTTPAFAQYNTLWIPDTLSGPTFNLAIHDTSAQFRSGARTPTAAVNTNRFWGPTLIMRKGDRVQANVRNNLSDETTVHWHGLHLPAVMDGGPHQVIAAGADWQPYWTVMNNAATYWYHPHLHRTTTEQIAMGIGGFIIIRDDVESRLDLPRTYGVDDIPLALTSRRFSSSNAISLTGVYGDHLLTNGTPDAEVSLPRQFVRLRLLNAEIQRGYNLGFSDNRVFYLIANDGGLLDVPVPLMRVRLMTGERVEILVDLSNDDVSSSLDLKAFNSGQAFGFPGGEPATTGAFGSLLNNRDFRVLHINVVATTGSPVTSLPTRLTTNVYWTANDATVSRTISVTGGMGMMPFEFDHRAFDMATINQTVRLDAVEKWTIVNNHVFGHTFHIHDVQFKLVSRSSGPVGVHEAGWKDVLYLPVGESATFVTRFEDYADPDHPFMYHCHFTSHEDGGMMGQFLVLDATATGAGGSIEIPTTASLKQNYPNPFKPATTIQFRLATPAAVEIRVFDVTGRLVASVPDATYAPGENSVVFRADGLSSGVYTYQLVVNGQATESRRLTLLR